MAPIEISGHDQFAAYLGKELGASNWFTVTQKQINLFADATLDDQWIHTDTERAVTESPFKTTIAHGYLTLSLIPHLWKEVVHITNIKMEVNYEINNLRFNQPVTVNSQIRLVVRLGEITNLRGVTKAALDIKVEIKDQKKSALDGRVTFLYHFN